MVVFGPFWLALLLFAFSNRLAAGDPGTSRLDAIAATTGRLSHVVVPADDDTTVPPEARSLLTELKHELRDEILARLDEAHRERRKPETVLAVLEKDLRARGWKPGACWVVPARNLFGMPEAGGCTYGGFDVSIARPRGHRDLLAVTTTLGIACGTDSSLYLLRDEPAGWRLLLALEENGYDKVSGALGSFESLVSPRDSQGGFFVAAADINPWCTSNWQRIRLRVFRVGPDPEHPIQVLAKEGSVFLGDGFPFYRLTADAGRVALAFNARQGLDVDILVREHIWMYAVGERTASRRVPLARQPEGFVDEWLALPWDEAVRWSDPSRPELERWHATAQQWTDKMYTGISEVRSRGRNRWEVEVYLEPSEASEEPPPTPAQSLVFTVIRRHDAFVLQGVESLPAEPDPQ